MKETIPLETIRHWDRTEILKYLTPPQYRLPKGPDRPWLTDGSTIKDCAIASEADRFGWRVHPSFTKLHREWGEHEKFGIQILSLVLMIMDCPTSRPQKALAVTTHYHVPVTEIEQALHRVAPFCPSVTVTRNVHDLLSVVHDCENVQPEKWQELIRSGQYRIFLACVPDAALHTSTTRTWAFYIGFAQEVYLQLAKEYITPKNEAELSAEASRLVTELRDMTRQSPNMSACLSVEHTLVWQMKGVGFRHYIYKCFKDVFGKNFERYRLRQTHSPKAVAPFLTLYPNTYTDTAVQEAMRRRFLSVHVIFQPGGGAMLIACPDVERLALPSVSKSTYPLFSPSSPLGMVPDNVAHCLHAIVSGLLLPRLSFAASYTLGVRKTTQLVHAYLEALQHARRLGALPLVRQIEVYNFSDAHTALAHYTSVLQQSHLREVAQRCGLWVLLVYQKGALLRVKAELDLKRARWYWMAASAALRTSGDAQVIECLAKGGVPTIVEDLVFSYEYHNSGTEKSPWQHMRAASIDAKKAFVQPPSPSAEDILRTMLGGAV